jgi:hypothetical protein
MKINNHNTTIVKQRAETLRIKSEIKSLYRKKQYLHILTYKKTRRSSQQMAQHLAYYKEITKRLQAELTNTYVRQKNKIEALKQINLFTTQQNTLTFPFSHRTKNLSNTSFSEEEYTLLNKGLQFNLGHKRKD